MKTTCTTLRGMAAACALLLAAAGCSNEPGGQLGFDDRADNEGRPPAVSDAERALAGTGSMAIPAGEAGAVGDELADTLDPVGDAVQTGVEQGGDAAAGAVGATEIGTAATGAADRDPVQMRGLEDSGKTVDRPTQQ